RQLDCVWCMFVCMYVSGIATQCVHVCVCVCTADVPDVPKCYVGMMFVRERERVCVCVCVCVCLCVITDAKRLCGLAYLRDFLHGSLLDRPGHPVLKPCTASRPLLLPTELPV